MTTVQAPDVLELETTGLCQLRCGHCYASSGPGGGTGVMTVADWERVIREAATLGVRVVQFIGGEPTLDKRVPRLAWLALGLGLRVSVYTNLARVGATQWALFSSPGVSLSTSWYAADAEAHERVTGSRGAWAATRANIEKAVRLGIPVRAAVVAVLPGQDLAAAEAELRELGVTDIRVRPVQAVGRAGGGDEGTRPGCAATAATGGRRSGRTGR
jgi:MoaA/NifB/PqqE/SkfB family radical SAM enzyme